ncbi:Protease inhibitor seed storage LTP family protein precursor [Musa troglodytarum]|uniref:Protease inhibitor seed storage LTP family protein n=1 Tax=Musa troglodytarum TaxID=320322 RepID=A0A9E7JNF3_9LILI|nr:Protease inhibitor seed storage LTP family protein precursor [Musa troglodytarum]
MAKKAFQVGLELVVMTIVLSGLASAQSGCTTAIISLAPCLSYITGNSSAPSSSCCSQLASVVKSEPACLCSVLNGGASSFGITVNQTRALAMPAACKVQTPPVSECNCRRHSDPTPFPFSVLRCRWTGKVPDIFTSNTGDSGQSRTSDAIISEGRYVYSALYELQKKAEKYGDFVLMVQKVDRRQPQRRLQMALLTRQLVL